MYIHSKLLRPNSNGAVRSTADQKLAHTVKHHALYCILVCSQLSGLACRHLNHLDSPIITCDSEHCATGIKVQAVGRVGPEIYSSHAGYSANIPHFNHPICVT